MRASDEEIKRTPMLENPVAAAACPFGDSTRSTSRRGCFPARTVTPPRSGAATDAITYRRSPLKWSPIRATAASLQASPLAWLQATRTAKSFLGASQATANHMVLLPAWVRGGPPAQGWPSTIIQPIAYFVSPRAGAGAVWIFSSVSALSSLVLAEGRLAAANLAQSPME